MRSSGSARFDPYYKIQWYDSVSMTWRDIQKAYPTVAAAHLAAPADKNCRIVEISEEGRRVL